MHVLITEECDGERDNAAALGWYEPAGRAGGALKTWETVETATTPAPRAMTADELADEVLRRLDTAKTDPVITVTSADPTITIDRDTDPATKE